MSAPTLNHQASGYDARQAYCMAQAAELAYADRGRIEATAAGWGFDRVRHHHSTFTPPFALSDTQAYTAASPTMIVTAFRGTEPVQLRDWLSDTTTPPWPGPANTGLVHYGFAEALRAVFPSVRSAITELRDAEQTVWFTGHSLGGALAMLAAAWLHFEDPSLSAHGVYTFGQPRTCDRALAVAYDRALSGRTFRVVNNNDIVTQVPPGPAFRHVAALRYIDSSGRVRESAPMASTLLDRAKGMTADPFAPAADGMRDHFMKAYVTALEKNLP
ncbi:lipase family protein [Umezawaea endophytica]|uniref:Lipase family protein n=1 Tax=Umezawaea endophytica TaxID=1654476 RepID=A0A9X2VIB8_9PSEU|nr:lipase family protein [Umezawaea endophytica]MCS7477153.1 lipase family protein [Umezawaea endophytica]